MDKPLYAQVKLEESEILSICQALDTVNYGIDVGYGDKDLATRRKLHTALTLARLYRIDRED